MPTYFIAQNGAQLQQSTPISVEGCSTSLAVLSHKIKKQTVTLSIYAPVAGKLKLSGKGLNPKTITTGAGAVTAKLTQTKPGKLKTKVSILFTPTTGRDRNKQTKTLGLSFIK